MLKTLKFLVISILAASAWSCDSWEPVLDGKTGQVDFSELAPQVDTSVSEMLTSASSQSGPDVSGYIVTLHSSAGETVGTWRYADIPQVITLPVGQYSLEVVSHQAQGAEWDTPLYSGKLAVTVSDGEISRPGAVTCTRSGAEVLVRYSDALASALSDGSKVHVSLDDNTILDFVKGETRTGCFNLLPGGDASFVAVLTGEINGAPVSVTRAVTGVKPASRYTLTFSLNTGSIDPSISVDVTVTEEDVDINIGADMPTITSQTLDLSSVTELTLENYESITALVDIKAPKGIKELHVKIESDLLTEDELLNVGLAGEFDLCNPGELEEALQGLGFPTGSDVVGKTEQPFDITFFLSLLVYFPGNNNFYITVVDNAGNSVTQGVLFHVPAE